MKPMQLLGFLLLLMLVVVAAFGVWLGTQPPIYYATDVNTHLVHRVPPPPLTQPQRTRCGLEILMSGLTKQRPKTRLCPSCYRQSATAIGMDSE